MSEELPPRPGGLAIGSVLAGYRCEEEIGRGGMAVVYRAHDQRLDRQVALKVLAPDLSRDELFRARFIQESRIAAATEHPHIIPVFNAGEADGVLYLAMRYVPDGDVRSLIDRLGPLPVARATALIGQAASALDAAHARGLIHRDVKPTNMLLELSSRTSRPDHLYLSDFGLAKPSTAASGLTMTGQFFGTVDYVAPEQIQSRPLDGRTDQYALACTSFEMLSGSPPFKRDNGMAVISAHLSEPPPRLSDRRPDLPPAVDEVLARALAKSPADRYERCLDFAEALTAAARAGPGAVVAGGEPHPPTRIAAASPATRADPGGAAAPAAGSGLPAAAAAGAAGAAAAAAGQGAPTVLPRGPGYPNVSPPTDPRFTNPRRGGGQPPAPPAYRGTPGPGGQPAPGDVAWWGGRAPAPPPPPGSGGPPRRRSRGAVAAGVIVALVVLFLAAAGVTYLVMHRHTAGTPAPVLTTVTASPSQHGSSPAGSTTASPPPPVTTPAATVQAYYAAINGHHYARAWRLGGSNSGSSYSNFVSGYATTRNDTVTILSVSGNVVTARVAALQTDGTLKTYQGTYTVNNGVISQFNVHQVS
jgi:tRNA A-37 threonylcarbamoyl transferase component Bud32